MPSATPISDVNDLLVSVNIKVSGSTIPEVIEIDTVYIHHEINKISYAEITLVGDDDYADNNFSTTDGTLFDPGSPIQISAGYQGASENVLFKGSIVETGIELGSDSFVRTKIICKHDAVKLTLNRTDAMFTGKTDSQILTTILGNYSGFSPKVDSTSAVQEYMYQKMATDWDFILARASFNGFVITMDGTNLNIGSPLFSGTELLTISLAESSIYSLEANISAEKQPAGVKAYAWDIKTQALINATAKDPSLNAQGSVTAKKLSTSLSQSTLNYTSLTPMVKEELQTWADSTLLQHRMCSLKGTVTFIGNGLIKTGGLIKLDEIGKKFTGSAYVSAVTHSIEKAIWKTTAAFGLDYKPVFEQTDFSYPVAMGQLPAIYGLQLATVKKISADPQSIFRIQVSVPSAATNTGLVWARYANFYATNGAGSFFMPEVGDEVVIGFIDGDSRYPVVLGSLYSNAQKSPVTANDDKNTIKSLTTKSKLIVEFDDEKKNITIKTPGGNSILISDADKGITIQDQNSNSIKMSSSGIDISSNSNINIKAGGNISIKATGNAEISATGNTTIKGVNVSAEAQVGFTGKGNATAELSASGQTTVKGAIVMIN